MSNYCITTKEIWYGNLYLDADDIDDAVHRAEIGEGDQNDSDFGELINYVSIRDTDTDEETDLGAPPIIANDNDPNNVFVKSKKQEEVDKAIAILGRPSDGPFDRISGALKVLRNIKNI